MNGRMLPQMARVLVLSTLLGVLASPALALAWRREATLGVRVHSHLFYRVLLESSDCRVTYKLHFSAPKGAYSHPGRERYRFHVRVQLDNGRSLRSPVFSNRAPGERVYAQSYDTTAEGCWAKLEHKLFGIDVQGCRGQSCQPESFR